MAARTQEGFYISPAFLDKLSIHVAKNFLELPKIKVPLILGIWGGKGQGKTFQVRLPAVFWHVSCVSVNACSNISPDEAG